MTSSDPTIIASALALALGIVKVIEALVQWGFKKVTGQNGQVQMTVQLSPEVSGQIRDVHGIVGRTNSDGSPLVYGPRAEVHAISAAIESVESKLDFVLDGKTKKGN